jgi:hypothetical protein
MSTVPSFVHINIGAYANDSTGDSLRVAFEKVNQNFGNVWNIVNGNGSGNISGNVAVTAIPNTLVLRDNAGSGFFNGLNANTANLNSVTIDGHYSLPTTAGILGQALLAGSNGVTLWGNITASVPAPGGNSQIIFNYNGQLAAAPGFTTDGNNITVNGNVTSLIGLNSGNLTISNIARVIGNTVSTSSSSGALIIAGGVGVAGNINAQGNIYVNGVPVLTGLSFPQTNIYNLRYNNLGTSQIVIDSVVAANVTAINYSITAIDNANGFTSSGYVTMLYDGANIFVSQFGLLNSNSIYPAAQFDGNVSGGFINLLAIGNSSNVTVTSQRVILGSNTPAGNVTIINSSGKALINNTPLAGNRFLSSVTNFSNITTYGLCPGNMINYLASSWTATLGITGGTGISIKSAAIVTTSTGNLTPITVTPITFNGYPFLSKTFITTPTFSNPQFIVTDPINAPMNPNFDHWLLFYFDTDLGGMNANLGMFRNLLAGSLVGSQASGNLLSIPTMPTISSYNATGIWSINFVS